LPPTLEAGQVVLMDDLPAHKLGRVRQLIEELGYELISLPSYSPDFAPIEELFGKLQGYGAPSRTSREGGIGWDVGRSAFGGQCPGP
jgi:transposase